MRVLSLNIIFFICPLIYFGQNYEDMSKRDLRKVVPQFLKQIDSLKQENSKLFEKSVELTNKHSVYATEVDKKLALNFDEIKRLNELILDKKNKLENLRAEVIVNNTRLNNGISLLKDSVLTLSKKNVYYTRSISELEDSVLKLNTLISLYMPQVEDPCGRELGEEAFGIETNYNGQGIISIGDQTWTSKNLEVTKYRNGNVIPQVQDKAKWSKLKTGAWCYYENKTANGTKYGKLYNWYAVNDPRGLAPKGYHIPTYEEWTILTDYLGGLDVAGTEMKSTQGWDENRNGTNSSSFNGLPGGYRDFYGNFFGVVDGGDWWSSSEYGTNYAEFLKFDNSHQGAYSEETYGKQLGRSVRCLRD